MPDIDLVVVVVAIFAFLLGGVIKGLSGIGLPMVALPILSLSFPMPQAVAMTMVPILITNGWQALTSGALVSVVRRFWPMQLILAVVIVLAAGQMKRLDNSVLLISAGGVLVVSVLGLMLSGGRIIPSILERPVGIAVALVAGAIGSVSSLFAIPIIIYMSSLGLSRAEFITSISIIYLFAGLPYLAGLWFFGAVAPVALVWSALMVVPAMTGLILASRLMLRVEERRFRQILNVVLIGLGLMMILRGVL